MSCQTGRQPAGDMHRWVRPAVQIGFLALSLLVGWQFHRFVVWLASPQGAPPVRPASVDAWLPISSFISLVYFFRTGQLSSVHPAGLVIFSLILALSVTVGRSFCSWVCPMGTLSEWCHRLGRRIFGRNLNPPRWIDIPLRSLRYLLLGFFVYVILMMPPDGLEAFLEGPYNRIADVKMYLMFAEMTTLTALVLVFLVGMSVMIRNFWCRYLCPYGALLGLLAWLSPVAVRRDAGACTSCGKCERACPNRVRVMKRKRVRSLECTTCFQCVQACPTPAALDVTWPAPKRRLRAPAYAAILIGAFLLVSQAAQTAGYWQSDTAPGLYASLYGFVRQIKHPQTRGGLSMGRHGGPAAGNDGARSVQPGSLDRPSERSTDDGDGPMPRTRQAVLEFRRYLRAALPALWQDDRILEGRLPATLPALRPGRAEPSL